jgi:hypothetical protein
MRLLLTRTEADEIKAKADQVVSTIEPEAGSKEKFQWFVAMVEARANEHPDEFKLTVTEDTSDPADLRKQRDELVKAAKAMMGSLRALRDERPDQWDALIPEAVDFMNAWDLTKAAIKKAEANA